MDNKATKKSFVASLTVPTFASVISNVMLTLLVADIALTFFGNTSQASVGIVSQLGTVNSVGEAIVALLMGFLVIRFRHKLLYLSGVLLVIVSAIGNFFASIFLTMPTLMTTMQFFYFLEGMGSMMVVIIASTLIGNLLPAKQKGKTVSYVVASSWLVPVVGSPIVNYFAEAQGWNYNYLLFVFPAAVVGLLIALYGVPFEAENAATNKNSVTNSFRKVLTNRSAVFFLLTQFFFVASSISLYTLPYFRTAFSVPRSSTIYIYMAASGLYFLSSLITGRLLNRLTAKKLAVIGILLDGIFIIGIFSVSTLWASLALNFSHVWFAGMAIAAFSCLILDQVPEHRGTMISLNRVFGKAGDATTPLIGGFILVAFSSYSILGWALGLMSLIGALLVFFFVRNPVAT